MTDQINQEQNSFGRYHHDNENEILLETANTSSNEFIDKRTTVWAFTVFFFLGFAPWLLVNALFLEIPIFIAKTPETCSIMAYISIMIQLANSIAFLYVWIQNYFPIRYSYSVSATIITAIFVSILMGFFWDSTAIVFGKNHSVGLFILTFFGGAVGCISMVVYFPFASQYSQTMTSAVSAGMGSNNLINSIVTVVQNPGGKHPRFGIRDFFLIMTGFLVLSLICFVYILNSTTIQKFKRKKLTIATASEVLINSESEALLKSSQLSEKSEATTKEVFIAALGPILNQLYNCTINYMLMSIIPYAFSAFHNSRELYMWSMITSMIANSLGRIFCAYYQNWRITFINFVQTFFWVYLVIMSFLGPKAPQLGGFGGWIIVIVNCIFSFINGYEVTIIFQSIYVGVKENMMEKASRFVGLSNQFGAMTGTVIAFVIVMVVFPQSNGC